LRIVIPISERFVHPSAVFPYHGIRLVSHTLAQSELTDSIAPIAKKSGLRGDDICCRFFGSEFRFRGKNRSLAGLPNA
jgi:hypothetical protein